MKGAAGQNKKVPDTMVVRNFFPDEEERTKCIKGAAEQ